MNMLTGVPAANCPYCTKPLGRWADAHLVHRCAGCDRPLGRVRVSRSVRLYRIMPMLDVTKILGTVLALAFAGFAGGQPSPRNESDFGGAALSIKTPAIIRNAQGGYGYTCTDLAAIRYRVGTLHADRLIYEVGTPQETHKADPTGVGDAFRAGFLSGLSWGLELERCAQVGALLATYVIESIGTQEYKPAQAHFLSRLTEAYGEAAAADVAAHIGLPRG